MHTLTARVTIDPEICHGKPVIRGLRYPVEMILEMLSAGMTTEEVLADYADLEREDISAALAFATRLSQVKRLELIKDADFVNSFHISGRPSKLLLISTGNISNADLEAVILPNLAALIAALEKNAYVELSRTALVVHA